MRIVIAGGTSHIARAIVPYFLAAGDRLTLFARRPELLAGTDVEVKSDFGALTSTPCDILINCIGAGTPDVVSKDPSRWFTVLEEFDELALRSLREKNPEALYIHFSSGAVYDRRGDELAGVDSCRTIFPNRICTADYYSIAKLYAEAKHRAHRQLRILDLRIFSFFSRYIKVDSGYFMTDLVTALLEGKELTTSPGEMIRDYPHPADLSRLIIRCAREEKINRAIDVASAAPLAKSEILKLFSEKFALRCNVAENSLQASPNGEANIYLPTTEMAEKAVAWLPEFTSADTLVSETQAILSKYGKA